MYIENVHFVKLHNNKLGPSHFGGLKCLKSKIIHLMCNYCKPLDLDEINQKKI